MLTEIISRIFYVVGKVSTANVTNEMLKDSITDKQYKAMGKKATTNEKTLTDKQTLYTRFDWAFKTVEDSKANDVNLRVAAIEGYLSDDLTDDEKAELYNIQARRSGSTKVSNVANANAAVLKWAIQNFKRIDVDTAKKVKQVIESGMQAVDILDKIISGDKLDKAGNAKIKIEL